MAGKVRSGSGRTGGVSSAEFVGGAGIRFWLCRRLHDASTQSPNASPTNIHRRLMVRFSRVE